MKKTKDELDWRIDELVEEEKRIGPTPFLSSKIEQAYFSEMRQTRAFSYQPVLQGLISGLIILVFAALGFLSVNVPHEKIAVEDNNFYFNDMKLEYPENALLQ